eukprot:610418-Pleurochrysis_carterae.AAC.1
MCEALRARACVRAPHLVHPVRIFLCSDLPPPIVRHDQVLVLLQRLHRARHEPHLSSRVRRGATSRTDADGGGGGEGGGGGGGGG